MTEEEIRKIAINDDPSLNDNILFCTEFDNGDYEDNSDIPPEILKEINKSLNH